MWGYKTIILISAVFCLYDSVAAKEFPAHFPKCSRSDPNMQDCLLKATEQVRGYIRNGLPDFFPDFEKFVVPEISMQQGTRAVNYKALLRNVVLLGLDQYKFTRYEFVTSNLTFFIEVTLPHLYLEAHYNVDGNILFAPIKGDGQFHANISNSNCSIYQEVKTEIRNGVEYLKPTLTIPKMNVGTVTDYAFDGLFRDNEQLAKATNIVIKDNLKVLVEELSPAVEKVLAAVFDDVIFKSVTQVPYDKLYPK